jgi:hypothetical protein
LTNEENNRSFDCAALKTSIDNPPPARIPAFVRMRRVQHEFFFIETAFQLRILSIARLQGLPGTLVGPAKPLTGSAAPLDPRNEPPT